MQLDLSCVRENLKELPNLTTAEITAEFQVSTDFTVKEKHEVKCHKVAVNSLWEGATVHCVDMHALWMQSAGTEQTCLKDGWGSVYLFGILLGTRRLRFQPDAQEQPGCSGGHKASAHLPQMRVGSG